MRLPDLWAGMGRAVNNLVAALVTNGSVTLLLAGRSITLIVLMLVLFVAAILLPLTNAQYNPAAGGMIAALIAGAFFAWMERQIRKVMPNALDTFLSPLLVLIIGAFALMLVQQKGDTSLAQKSDL